MKRDLLLALLVSATFFVYQAQAQKHWSDVISVYETAVQAADPTSKDMKVSLAVMWDLLPDGTNKKNGATSYFNKFRVQPSQVNLSDAITSFRQHKAQCTKAADICTNTYKSYQTKIKEKDKKIGDQAAEITKLDTDLGNLNTIINSATEAEKTLLDASEFLRNVAIGINPFGLSDEEIVTLVVDAYQAYVKAIYKSSEIGKDLNINMPGGSYFIDLTIKAQIDPHGENQAALKSEAIAEAQKQTLDETVKAVDQALGEIGSHLPV